MFDSGPGGQPTGMGWSVLGLEWPLETTGALEILALSGIDLAGRSSAELLMLIAAWERQEAWLAAQKARVTAAAAAKLREDPERTATGAVDDLATETMIEAEIGTALRLAPTTARRRVAVAEDLIGRLPATGEALSRGLVSYWQAAAIAEGTAGLTDTQARLIEERVLEHAPTSTVMGLRRRIDRARLMVNPRDTSERAKAAADRRHVRTVPDEDGMAEFRAYGPAPQVQALYEALDITAGRVGKADGRSIGARRFDALMAATVHTLDAASCPPPAKVAATVFVTIDLPTLLGLQNHPAELHGYGPLPAPMARMLAADNGDRGWYRFVHDPVTGAPLDLGTLRRKPSAEIVRWVKARDATCLFVGCYRSAWRCDLDHRIEVADGGPTNEDNLTPLCKKHHPVKSRGWRYVRYEDRVVWTSPNGQTYTRYLNEAHHDLIGLLAAGAVESEPVEFDEVAHFGTYSVGFARPDDDPAERPSRQPPANATDDCRLPPDAEDHYSPPSDVGQAESHGPPDDIDITALTPPNDIDINALTPPDDLAVFLEPHDIRDLTLSDDDVGEVPDVGEPPDIEEPPDVGEPPDVEEPSDVGAT